MMKTPHLTLLSAVAASAMAIGSAQAALLVGIGIQYNDNNTPATPRTVSV